MKLFDGNLRLKFRWLGSVKPLCLLSIRSYWPNGLWLGTQGVSLLDLLPFRLVSALFSACLIFFPSFESLAIRPDSYLATASQPRTDQSVILINLFRGFSFPGKSSQRSLALLASSFFKTDEIFWTILCLLNSNCTLSYFLLYVWIWKCPPFWRIYLMIVVIFSIFS